MKVRNINWLQMYVLILFDPHPWARAYLIDGVGILDRMDPVGLMGQRDRTRYRDGFKGSVRGMARGWNGLFFGRALLPARLIDVHDLTTLNVVSGLICGDIF